MRTDNDLPPVVAPLAAVLPMPKPPLVPCPQCGGSLVSALIGRADALFCSACPWALPDLPAGESGVAGG